MLVWPHHQERLLAVFQLASEELTYKLRGLTESICGNVNAPVPWFSNCGNSTISFADTWFALILFIYEGNAKLINSQKDELLKNTDILIKQTLMNLV